MTTYNKCKFRYYVFVLMNIYAALNIPEFALMLRNMRLTKDRFTCSNMLFNVKCNQFTMKRLQRDTQRSADKKKTSVGGNMYTTFMPQNAESCVRSLIVVKSFAAMLKNPTRIVASTDDIVSKNVVATTKYIALKSMLRSKCDTK